jgi:hypothetical protein
VPYPMPKIRSGPGGDRWPAWARRWSGAALRWSRRGRALVVAAVVAASAVAALCVVPGTVAASGAAGAVRIADAASSTSYTTVHVRHRTTLKALAKRYRTTVRVLEDLNSFAGSVKSFGPGSLRIPAGKTRKGHKSGTAHKTGKTGNSSPPSSTSGGSGAASGTGTGTSSGASSATSRAFQGIYAFSGGNTSTLAADPDVAGRSLVYYWAQLEPQRGQYDWALIDRDMQPWIAAGKKVILRVAAAGWAKWDTAADSAHGTPAWVYAQGVQHVTEQDGAVMPQYWNPVFQGDLAEFLKAFAARYDGNAHVAAVDISLGVGGESKADSENNPGMLGLWQKIGYTDQLWWSYAQQTITDYTADFHRTPLALMPDKTFIGNTPGYDEHTIVNYAVARNIWLQDNGVLPGRTLSAPWGKTPVIAEMRGSTAQSGDSLSADLSAALAEHPVYILVFTSDITAANRAALHQVALQAHTGA